MKTYRRLLGYAWPENIRELESALRRALLVAAGASHVKPEHLSLADDVSPKAEPTRGKGPSRAALLAALERTGWNISEVAREFNTGRQRIYRLMERYDLRPPPR